MMVCTVSFVKTPSKACRAVSASRAKRAGVSGGYGDSGQTTRRIHESARAMEPALRKSRKRLLIDRSMEKKKLNCLTHQRNERASHHRFRAQREDALKEVEHGSVHATLNLSHEGVFVLAIAVRLGSALASRRLRRRLNG
mmetsp:Transcript_73/g.292  ORF Transcript_73/g.292 Transcript_73/m.292 type:complete len:140 (-) Transcript_73:1682-2101(-)